MNGSRLRDITILAIERDITVDFDQTVEEFSKKHWNGRILLFSMNTFTLLN